MKAYIFAIVILLPMLTGCKEDVPPTSGTSGEGGNVFDASKFDYRLVGSWSTFDGTISKYGASGMQFGFDKSLRFLGTDPATGELIPLGKEEIYMTQLLSADNGIISLEHTRCYYPPTETLYVRYRIEGNDLILLDYFLEWWPTTLHRTRLGTNVAVPHPFTFSVKINGVRTESRPGWSPYVWRESPTKISLFVELPSPWAELFVPIDSFAGPGTYRIRDDQVWFRDFCDDQIQSNYLFDSLSHNTVTITEFNIALNRCSGYFDLDVGLCTCIPFYYRFRDGFFSVPIIGNVQSNQVLEQALRRRATPILQ